jgi:hypothetical protein
VEGAVQKGIQFDSVGFEPARRDCLEAGRIYTDPDFERHITFSPLTDKLQSEEWVPYCDIRYIFVL